MAIIWYQARQDYGLSHTGETLEVGFEIDYINLMSRSIPVIEEEDGIRAITKDKAIDPKSVSKYISKKFGDVYVLKAFGTKVSQN